MRRSQKILNAVSNAALIAAAGGLAAMALVIGWQVFGRKVLNDSPAWSESVALLLMLYFVLLAAASGVLEDFHLRFRLLDRMLPEKYLVVLRRFVNLVVAVFGVLMVLNGARLADFTSTHVIPTLGISREIAYWPFVLSGIMITIFALAHVFSWVDSEGEPN